MSLVTSPQQPLYMSWRPVKAKERVDSVIEGDLPVVNLATKNLATATITNNSAKKVVLTSNDAAHSYQEKARSCCGIN